MPSVLRRNRAFRRLWAAGAVSLVGDWLSLVAVATLASASGAGAFAIAAVFAAHALPGAVLAPFAGAIVDGFDRRRVLVAADCIAAALTTAMVVAAIANEPYVIVALLLVRSGVTSLVPPGESAAVRVLVDEADFLGANTILAATWSIAFVIGMALGGVAAMLGPTLALVLDTLSFAIAAAVHGTLPRMPIAATPRSLARVVRETPRDTVVALRVAAAHPRLLGAVVGKMPLALAGGGGWVALNVLGEVARPFGAAALSFGLLQAVRGAGTGIGPALAGRLAARGVSEGRLQALALVLCLGAIPCLSIARSPVALTVAVLAWGMGTGANWVLMHSSLQRLSSVDVIGRLAAFDELLVAGAMVTSAFVGAAVIEYEGLYAAPLVVAALGIVGVLVNLAIVARSRSRNA